MFGLRIDTDGQRHEGAFLWWSGEGGEWGWCTCIEGDRRSNIYINGVIAKVA